VIVGIEIDQFERTVAEVSVAERSVNLEAVASGHALAFSTGRAELLSAEAEARTSALGMWAADICGATAPKVSLEIVDVLFDPPGRDQDEQVTIRNVDSQDIDLEGFVLRDESSVNRFRLPSITMRPGSELIISTDCRGGVPMVFLCSGQPVWNNGGDTALLLDTFGRVVAVFRYP